MMDLETYLRQQPEITQAFESDQLELIKAIESAARGNLEHCFMGRGRGTTTILLLARKWLAEYCGFRWPIVIAPRAEPQDKIYSVHRMRGLTKAVGTERIRPDAYLVDFWRSQSRVEHDRNLESLRMLSNDIKCGVLVNVSV